MRSPLAALTALALTACATSPTYQAAAAINGMVNNAIEYTEDAEQYGRRDVWVANPASGKGDCEDYALTKKAALQEAGLPATLGVCVGGIGWHAVTLVQDGAETWVLDNRYDYPVRKADYTDCKVWVRPETVERLAQKRKL